MSYSGPIPKNLSQVDLILPDGTFNPFTLIHNET
jgi:hypothetical protein